VHFNFVTGYQHPCGFTREELLAQAALFRQRFGRDSVCGVNHSVRWVGWAEPGRWMREAGCKADNSFFGWTSPPTNPVNTIGFVHGSAFPRHLWDDAAHGKGSGGGRAFGRRRRRLSGRDDGNNQEKPERETQQAHE